jgi:RNA polymerase sigma-70 factor, ECF subfamily
VNVVSTPETYSDETLYRDYFTPVYRFLFFRTRDYDVAIDLTQTAFLKFMSQKAKPVSGEYAIKQLFVIARNTLTDYWRSAPVRLSEARATLDLEKADMVTVEQQLEQTEMKAFFDTIVTTLTDLEQEVVSLRITSDLSYDSIAEMTHLTPQNCRQIYSRALRTMKEHVTSSNYFK